MPPSIPTSLNFGQASAPPSFYSWPRSVLSFLGKVLKPGMHVARSAAGKLRGGEHAEEGDDDGGSYAAHTISSKRGQGGPSRKVSRADAAEALARSLRAGIRLPELDVGLVLTQPGALDAEVDVSTEEGQRQALLQATEQVVASVRTTLAQRSRARAQRAQQFENDGEEESSAQPPRILLIGHHAEMRAQYLAHTCGFGVESGNNPSDCTWPLVLPEGAAPTASAFSPSFAPALSSDPSDRLQLRSEEGIHWSEDVDELYLLSPANPAHRFDIILVFGVQLDPTDISSSFSSSMQAAPAAAASNHGGGMDVAAGSSPARFTDVPSSRHAHASGPSIHNRNPTQCWMDHMNSILRQGGIFAGIAVFDEDVGQGAEEQGPAAIPVPAPSSRQGLVSSSPATTSTAASLYPPPLPLHPSPAPSSSPALPASAWSLGLGPLPALRCFRDRVESLGFFMSSCTDLGQEGEVVFQMPAAAPSPEEAATEEEALQATQEAEEYAMQARLVAQTVLGGIGGRANTPSPTALMHAQLESLVCARFFAYKNAPTVVPSASSASTASNTSTTSAGVSTVMPIPIRSGTPGSGMGHAAPLIRRSVSTGALAIALPPSGSIGSLPHAGNRSPALGALGGASGATQPRSLKIVTRPQVSPLLGMGGAGESPLGNPAAAYPAFPPTIAHSQLHHQIHGGPSSRSSSGRLGPSNRANASPSPSPLNLPPTASPGFGAIGGGGASGGGGSASSSAGPSTPKLSPSESLDSGFTQFVGLNSVNVGAGRMVSASHMRHSSAGVGGNGGGSNGLNALSLASLSQVPPYGPHSASSTPRSNHSSPGLYPYAYPVPATPHMSGPLREPIVVTGVSMGLPSAPWVEEAKAQGEGLFSRVNFDRIFAGQNCIAPLTTEDKSQMIGMRAAQIGKDKVTGARTKKFLREDKQLIQVASKMPPRSTWGLAEAYGLPKHVMEVLDATYELAVCAGLEALKDAGFSLKLSGCAADEIGLPESMRDETGVIFASSFPCMDSLVQEVSAKVRYDTQQELLELLGTPRPAQVRRSNAEDGSVETSDLKEAEYEYDRKLLFKLLVMANCQLAELIKARGPNQHINTACSGTTQAIATAEDWMRVGRCKRVIVISADVATSPACMPYLATGFLALGAASILPDAQTAAAPFDARRAGMILGAGSVGLVLEYASTAIARGGTPKSELMGTHQGNSAFHATVMDSLSISQQLHVFLRRIEMEQRSDFIFSGSTAQAEAFTKDLIYFAHETFTSANGGCAGTEMQALASIWPGKLGCSGSGEDASLTSPPPTPGAGEGASANANSCMGATAVRNSTVGSLGLARSHILLANSKGFTGHPMGVGFEDALAVEALATDRVPPIANFKTLDPRLSALISESQLSKGGEGHGRSFVLRMAGGFGNQFVYALYRKWTPDMQQTWAARLAASQALTASTGASAASLASQGLGGRGAVHAVRHTAGAYSYPQPMASSPNSCSTSAFISRVNSETNLSALRGSR